MNLIDKKEIAERYYAEKYVRKTTVSSNSRFIGVDNSGRCIVVPSSCSSKELEGITLFNVKYVDDSIVCELH